MTESHATAKPAPNRAATAPATPSRRGMNIALWILQVQLAALFVYAALPKLLAEPQIVAGFAELGLGVVGMYLVGVAELVGGIALLVPRTAGLSALAFVGLMTGAVVVTWMTFGAGMIVLPVGAAVMSAVVAWGRRSSTAALLRR